MNGLSIGSGDRHRFVARSEVFGGTADLLDHHVARARRAHAGEVGSQSSARAVHPMTARAVRAEEALSVLCVALGRIGWRRRGIRVLPVTLVELQYAKNCQLSMVNCQFLLVAFLIKFRQPSTINRQPLTANAS